MTEINNKSTISSGRRSLVLAAGVAALAGIGVGWWRLRDQRLPMETERVLWSAEFDQLDGQVLSLANLKGRPLVINFWATWCPPCVEEMPLLDAFYRENRDKRWQMIGLAIDQPSRVRQFLNQYPVSYPIALAGLDGSELMRALGNEAGALPYTVVLNAKGEVTSRVLGRFEPSILRTLIDTALKG